VTRIGVGTRKTEWDRQELDKEFIEEASSCYIDALQHTTVVEARTKEQSSAIRPHSVELSV
jgi:hypothetical protein